MGEGDQVFPCKILVSDLLVRLLSKISKLAQIMCAQTPGQLPPTKARLFPLSPESKIVCVPGAQGISDDSERGAAAPALLGMRRGNLPGQLVEVVREVVRV